MELIWDVIVMDKVYVEFFFCCGMSVIFFLVMKCKFAVKLQIIFI